MPNTQCKQITDDRITVRLGPYAPFVRELAECDERSVSDWVKRQLAKVVTRRHGSDPTRAGRSRRVA